MSDDHPLVDTKLERRMNAVLALFKGEPVAQITAQFGISRSNLYKFRQRAYTAIREALVDQPRGPQTPHNRLAKQKEEAIQALCQRRPTLSSYQVHHHLGPDFASPRTIQRVRQRLTLPRLPKRPRPQRRAKRFSPADKQLAQQVITAKPYLGPERLAWDLQNQYGLQISPSTVKRLKRAINEALYPPPAPVVWRFYERHHPHSLWHGDCLEKVTLTDIDRTAYQLTLMDDYSRGYVFCDLVLKPDLNTTIAALITAMRTWQTIPKAVVFDNGSSFKGHLLSAFCKNLGIRLIYTSVRHPQTNGKLERAFRDDMNEFYRQQEEWILEPLRRALPAYVHYRNYVRGHRALGGKPSITRLQEQSWFALPQVLEHLESYAWYEVGYQVVEVNGCIRVLGRNAYVDLALRGVKVTVYETLHGLEVGSKAKGCTS